MFRFWYRFVFPNMSAIVAGLGQAVYDNEVDEQLNAYMGLIFEDICKQWLFEMAKKNSLPFFIGNLGRWWGTNPQTRLQEEIDILASRKDEALFAECKWTNSKVDMDVYDNLKRKSMLFIYQQKYFYLFTKITPSDKLLSLEKEHSNFACLTFPEMIDSLSKPKVPAIKEVDNSADLPQANFYIQGGFDFTSKRGGYQLLTMFGDHTRYFEDRDLTGRSDVSMILLALIEGLKKLKRPCMVTVYSNIVFGISSIYKKGCLREAIPEKAANYLLKDCVLKLLRENGHVLKNIADSNVKGKIGDYR
jgi:ribonuclease HI